MKKSLLILCIAVFSSSIYAQNMFLPGECVTKGNKTYSGLIKITSEDQILFKTDRSSETRKFKAF